MDLISYRRPLALRGSTRHFVIGTRYAKIVLRATWNCGFLAGLCILALLAARLPSAASAILEIAVVGLLLVPAGLLEKWSAEAEVDAQDHLPRKMLAPDILQLAFVVYMFVFIFRLYH